MDPFSIFLGILSAGSSLVAGQQQAEASEAEALEAERQGREESRVVKEKAGRMRGTQRAGYGAAGVDIGYGSPQEIVLETLMNKMREDEAVLANARAAAGVARKRAKMAKISAIGQAAGNLMSVDWESA